MKFTAFFLILLFGLILQESNEFTFQMCSDEYGEICLEQTFDENFFSPSTIYDLYYENPLYSFLWIKQDDIFDDITINLDGIFDGIKISFLNQSFYTPITIQTNVDKNTDVETFSFPYLYVPERDLIIDNININNDQTVFIYYNIEYNTIIEKDKSKPLYIIRQHFSQFDYNFDRDISPILYLGNHMIALTIDKEYNESRTIISSPILFHTHDNNYEGDSNIYIDIYYPTTIIFGENQMRIEFHNSKTLTIIDTNHLCHVQINIFTQTVITVEKGVNEYNLIGSSLFSKVQSLTELVPEIQGDWPTIKTSYSDDQYIGDGKILLGYSKYFYISGNFLYSAYNFPVYGYGFTLILTKNFSSVFNNNVDIYTNMTILTKEEIETIFVIDGFCSYTNDNEFVKTESPLLKIYAKTNKKIDVNGPAFIAYKTIDNRHSQVSDVLDFLKGGSVVLPFGLDHNLFYEELAKIYEEYNNSNPQPLNNASSHVWFNYCINFAKEKISKLSSVINDLKNEFFSPLTIKLIEDESFKPNKKNTLTIIRNDIPITSLYSKTIDKQVTVLCIQNDIFNLTEWNVNLERIFLRGIFNEGNYYDKLYSKYVPKFTDTTFKFDKTITDDERCISILPKSIPKSAFEIFIYTSNETYIEILEKVNIVNVLTPKDLDATSKIINKNTKNFLVIILDDLPEGSSINMNKINGNSNIILVGFKANSIDSILECIQKNKELDDFEFGKYISQFASSYLKYQPKASITFTKSKTFVVANVYYTGTNIRCTTFWALLSSFPNLNDFSSQLILTETITYKFICNLRYTDLTLFPISLDPLNLLSIEQINFTEKELILKMKDFFQEEGYANDESYYFTIKTENIPGRLSLYTFDYSCTLTVPEEKADQKLKGVSINYFSLLTSKITDIHGIFTLEDKSDERGENNSPFSSIFHIFESIQNHISFIKDENEDEKNDSFEFTGNWDKVETIEGNLEINTGEVPAIINDVPAVVAESLDVKSAKSVQIKTQSEKMFFSKPQIIAQEKTISFENKNTIVNFSNLTFDGNFASLSLLIDGNPSKVLTDHILITSNTNAMISSELEIKESIEIGPESSIKANLISLTEIKLTLDYRLSIEFGTIPETIEPTEIILNYLGESDNFEDEIDYSIYFGIFKEIKIFNKNGHQEKCNEWYSKTSLQSTFYPEFRNKNQVVDFICINKQTSSVFGINVTSIAEGEVIIPSDDYDITADIDIGNDGDDDRVKKDKKKFSFFALVGIIVGVVILIVIVIVIIVAYKSMSKKQKTNKFDADNTENSLRENTDDKLTPVQKDISINEDNNNDKNGNSNQKNTAENDDESDMDFWIYP